MELDRYTQVMNAIAEARATEHDGSSLVALARLSRAADAFAELVRDLAFEAARDGFTQKAIAKALDMPESRLRGLKADAAATR
jgi:hypothetical protein